MSGGWTRSAVWLAVAAYFAAALAWLGTAPGEEEQVFDPGSAFDTSRHGLSLAHAYLQRRAGTPGGPSRVATLAVPLAPRRLEDDAVVLRVRPRHSPTALLSSPEQAWVRGGGRLVLALERPYGPLGVSPVASAPVEKVFPIWPSVSRVQAPAGRAVGAGAPIEAHAVLSAGGRPALLRWRLGRGEVLVLAVPELIENGWLERADHLALLEALAGRSRPVYFDEHAHGLIERPGILDLLAGWGFGPALLLLALSGGLAFWRERARLGPPEEGARERRSEAVDLLDSLGRLYERSLSPAQAQRLYRQGLERAPAARGGLKEVGPARPAGLDDGERRMHGTR